MSQVTTRRSRRQTHDEDSASSKASTPKPNGIEESPEENPPKPEETTPPPEETTAPTKEITENETAPEEKEKQVTNGHEEETVDTSTKEEMDPVILSDEPDPELVFEESSDLESGRDSPVLSRCKTRRSLTRNIPTPKTPKSLEEETPTPPVEAEQREGEELNMTFESCSTSTFVDNEDVSTKAEVGGDSTRLNYTESTVETNSFLQEVKNKSLGDTLKCLSRRRTIRPISDDYRKRLMQTNFDKQDVGAAYLSRNSVDRVSLVGIKRKSSADEDDDEEEELSKRFKSDSPGFFARLTSPLASIRNPFRVDFASSTPKLTGYKDENCLLEEGAANTKLCDVKDGERRWCSIM